MPSTEVSSFGLVTQWNPGGGDKEAAYTLLLTNRSGQPVQNFRLCVSGPARIDSDARVEGGLLSRRLSNFSEFAPPEGFTLGAGGTWRLVVHTLSYPLRHWSDGAAGAYLVFEDGTVGNVAVSPSTSSASNKPPLKGAAKFAVAARGSEPVSLIPWPNHISIKGGRPCPRGFAIGAGYEPAKEAAKAFGLLCGRLFPAEAIVRPAGEGGAAVTCLEAAGATPESCEIEFTEDNIVLKASDMAGFFYGLISLGQMLRGARDFPQEFIFPAGGAISDRPEMAWRGCHLDVARQFYATGEVQQLLAVMAWNKLNRFHWHLSDDEAWRVESDAFPALNTIASWRGHGLAIPPLLGTGPERSGGYYTKQAVRGTVALAGQFCIQIAPEIDVPGHCHALQAAIPALRDPQEEGVYHSVQGFPNNCLNPAWDETYAVIGQLFDELIELFPSKLFHIGADEVPLGAWSGSPQALRWLENNGGAALAKSHKALNGKASNLHGADDIEGTGAALLQGEFLSRIQAFLASRGCVTGGWEEAAHGGRIDKAKSWLVGWRSPAISGRLAGEGYDMVVSPGQAYYLDMSQSDEFCEPGAGWAGFSGPQATYEFDPADGWDEAQRRRLLGIQACIWSEPMSGRAVFDRLVFPRLSAIAETAWTRADAKSWARFSGAAGLMPILYGHWQE